MRYKLSVSSPQQYYSHYMGAKFVRIGDVFINVATIASIKCHHVNCSKTEILLVNGEAYVVDPSPEEVMNCVVEHVS